MKNNKYNFFEKIYWGWKQVYYNFDEWGWIMTGKNDEFAPYITLDLWIGLNINLSKVMEESL
jgi:hypothetical protein